MRISTVERALPVRRYLGRWSLHVVGHAGRFFMMIVDMVRGIPDWRSWGPAFLDQANSIGYGSLFIVLLISGFAGGVTALQTGYQFTGAYPLYIAGGLIGETVILELGPVMTGLVLAGRVGARIAAELGTMRVTEQIDALESLGRSPVTQLLLPRCLAGLLVIPALVMFSNATGFLVGWAMAKQSLGITNEAFEYGARYFFRSFDLWYSGIKAVFFAISITAIPCYIGFNTQQGAEGVGRATTQAVVATSITILLLDVLLAQVLLGK
jgi:phospholipid/cholesterol/gamma-HCH transport system permease protein